MSLRIFIKMPDVASKLKGLRPKFPRKIPVPLQVEPRSDRFPLVGMGFDYLLRMELQRRAPHAVSDRWTAESAPGLIWQRNDKGARWMPLSKDQNGRVYMADILGNEDDAREVAERAREVVDKAKAALAAYTKNTSPMPGEQADLAAHAIRLAKLDPLCRARVFDATFDEAAQEDVEDLVAMLAIVPFERLLHETVLLLNPTFGEASQAVRGADTDLIAGDMLIDFKTTTKTAMEGEYLDQILGYFFLARREQRVNPKFPEIKRLGIYFCRHGFLWTIEAKTWTDCPVFPEVEEWFFQRAGEVFGTSRPATKPRKKQWGPRTSRCTPAKDHEASCGIASGRQSRQLKLGLRRRSGSRGNTWTQPGKMRSTL